MFKFIRVESYNPITINNVTNFIQKMKNKVKVNDVIL